MEKIKKTRFLQIIHEDPHGELEIMGIQNGKFLLLYHAEKQSYIYCKHDGRHKEYPRIDQILDWIKRKTQTRNAHIRFDIWNDDNYNMEDIRER